MNGTCAHPKCTASAATNPRTGRRSKFCGEHRLSQNSRTKICSTDGCDHPVRARGLCVTHYNIERRKVVPEDRKVRNGDPARRAEALRTKSLFRKSVITAPDAESINLATLGERDGWTCGICGLPVDKTVQYPARMAPTVDHVTPISHGGRHRWDNVQLSHFACNMAKGDAVA